MLRFISLIFLIGYFEILFSQNINNPETPSFNNGFNQINVGSSCSNHGNPVNNTTADSYYNNSEVIESSKTFSTSYKAPVPNVAQNNQTVKILDLFKEAKTDEVNSEKKQLWELKLRSFNFVNPNSELYKKLKPYYDAAFDSINEMLTGERLLDLKKAVFLVENAFFQNKMRYSDFCKLIADKVYVINEVLKKEKLSRNNNIALNYAIQQLYMRPIEYVDRNGVRKTHHPFNYDFEDYMGDSAYSKQFVSKLLVTGKGQCHSMPLLYEILALEIGANASIAYSPEHSYIVFPDADNNFYNFECTSACFPSYSFIMSSGYISKEAVKSGIYTVPTTLKETIANQLNDLATQQFYQLQAVNDFQLKCGKRTLEFYPNDIMALMVVSNYQTAKTDAALCYAHYPAPKDVPNIPELKKEFTDRDNLYNYMDNLGYTPIPQEEYNEWLKAMRLERAKQESEEIQKVIYMKAKMQN